MLHHLEHVLSGAPLDESMRTEAVQFSPSGQRLAVADSRGHLLYFDVDTSSRPIKVSLKTVFQSSSFNRPHALAFISERVIAVASRLSMVEFYHLPELPPHVEQYSIESIHTLRADWFGAPGQTRLMDGRPIAVGPGALDYQDGRLYAGSNLENAISVHTCEVRDNKIINEKNRLLNKDAINIPDAMSISADGRWLAVGDHGNQRVAILDAVTGALACSLEHPELIYPHGVRFDKSGKHLLVSDAGGQGLHVFRTTSDWSCDALVMNFNLQGISTEKFEKTLAEVPEFYRPLEGGIKGIAYEPTHEVFVTTGRYQTLRFFALD